MFESLLAGVLSISLKEIGMKIGTSAVSKVSEELWNAVLGNEESDKLDEVLQSLRQIQNGLTEITTKITELTIDIKLDMVNQYVVNIESLYDELMATAVIMAQKKQEGKKADFQSAKRRMTELSVQVTNQTYNHVCQINQLLAVDDGNNSCILTLLNQQNSSKEFLSYFATMKYVLLRFYSVQIKALLMLCLAKDNPNVDFPDGSTLIGNVNDLIDQQEQKLLSLVPSSVVQLVQTLARNPQSARINIHDDTFRGFQYYSFPFAHLNNFNGTDLIRTWHMNPNQPIDNPDPNQSYTFALVDDATGNDLIPGMREYRLCISDHNKFRIECVDSAKNVAYNIYLTPYEVLDSGPLHLLFRGKPVSESEQFNPFIIEPYSYGLHGNTLKMNEYLAPGEYLESSNGVYKLIYQKDGTLELYKQAELIWKNTPWVGCRGVWRAIMQEDGNFVLYTSFESQGGFLQGTHPSWATNSDGSTFRTSYHLVLEDDGRFVIYRVGYLSQPTPVFDSSKNLPG